MTGVGAIVWKEWREVLLPNGRPGRQLYGLLAVQMAIPLVFGALFGQEPEAWAVSIGVFMGMIPIFTVLSYVIDSFAGERERHTLETLLATRLSDSSILMGKLLALLSFGAVFGGFGLIVVLVASPVFVGTGIYLVVALASFAFAMVGAMHYAVIASLIGILISMRVKTVRGGQQVFAFTALMPFMLITAGVPTLVTADLLAPDSVVSLLPLVVVGAAVATYGTMALLFVIALRQFRRERLLAR